MISLRYLYSKIEPYVISSSLSKDWDVLPYEIGFIGSRKRMRSGRLYITSAGQLSYEATADDGAAVIVCNANDETPKDGPSNNTFISLSCKTSQVYDIIDDAVEFSRNIDTKLEAIGDTNIAAKACALGAQLSNGTMAVTDPNGFIVAMSSREGSKGLNSDCEISEGKSMHEWIDRMENIDSLIGDEVEVPVTGTTIFGRLIGMSKRPKGYVFIEVPVANKDCLALATKLARFLDTKYSSNGLLMPDSSTIEFSKFWERVAKRELTSDKLIAEALAACAPQLKGSVSIGVVTYEIDGRNKSLGYVVSMLKMLIPDASFSIFADEIVLFMNNEARFEKPVFEQNEKINRLLEQVGAWLVVSPPTKRYRGLYTHYNMIKRTSVIARSIEAVKENDHIIYAEDYNTYYIIDLAVRKYLSIPGNDDIVFLTHPAIATLTRYDRQHRSNLRDTLYHYLLNDCNIAKTAEAIYMHRNTVMNKINKIKTLVGIDFNSPMLRQKLILSCQIARYHEEILSREIS